LSPPLNHVAELLRRETGIVIKGEQLTSLEAALARVEPGLDASTFLAARVDPSKGSALLARLIDEVTVKETFFLRQRQELDAIEWTALLASANAAGRDRIAAWVAGCATGEEAYSLALLASEAFACSDPPVSILATDISDAALESARRGSYGRRSLRGVDAAARERYFASDGEKLLVGPQLRRPITFRRHNLVGDAIPPYGADCFDLIACRNVLIYFDGDSVERVMRSLEQALTSDGMLLLGAADRLCGSARRLARLAPLPPAPAQRRKAAREPPAAVVEAPRRDATLNEALRVADRGDLAVAIETTARILHENPLDSDAHFIRGLVELGLGDAEAAASSFRRSLFIDPTFGLAAFKLGRAHEARGDRAAAYRAYERALRAPRAGDGRHAIVLDQIDVGDITAACAIRLRALGVESATLTGAPGGPR
jgi:chemotaxis methyl-accepting protein methylase